MQLQIKLWYFKRLWQTTGYYLPDCVSGTGTRLQLQIISLRKSRNQHIRKRSPVRLVVKQLDTLDHWNMGFT